MPPLPSTNYNLKAWICGSLTRPALKTKSLRKQLHDFGLDFEFHQDDGFFYVTRAEGLAKDFTEIKVGDRLIKFNDKDATKDDFYTLEQLNEILQKDLKITFEAMRPEKLGESITEIEMEIEVGDIAPLIGMDDASLNGKEVRVLRELRNNKWLVQVIETGKKILIKNTNLYFEYELDKVTTKEYEESSDSENDEQESENEEEDQKDTEELKKELGLSEDEQETTTQLAVVQASA